jgi:chemotaxis protein CheD
VSLSESRRIHFYGSLRDLGRPEGPVGPSRPGDIQENTIEEHPGKPLAVYLKPAGLFITNKPFIVTTVLGSCVSVTLFHQRLGLAAICHALLPQCGKEPDCTNCHIEKYKYVACVIPEMIQKISKLGIRAAEIEVKLFGGTEMFASEILTPSVGRQNIESAVRAIETGGMRLKNADVGGLVGRKIYFKTLTGQVFVKKLE